MGVGGTDFPVSAAYAQYRGQRLRVLFGGDDWVAVSSGHVSDMPDALDESTTSTRGETEPVVKLPLSALDAIVDVRVYATLRGHTVLVSGRTAQGRVQVWLLGGPDAAREAGLSGSQHDGWSGFVQPEELTDIRFEESRRS